ncbi:MAG: hypothetical protein AAB652_02185 [Patescibacteria group bacterium]
MKYFVYTIIAIVAFSVIAGFFIVGSPKDARLRQADEQRIQHLQNIQWQIVNYWQVKEMLPTKLSDLNDAIRGFTVPKDPETGADYQYTIKKTLKGTIYDDLIPPTFELCATFNRPSSQTSRNVYPVAKPFPANGPGFVEFESYSWEHAEGRVCFERTIDPDRYPPFKD